MSEDPPPRGSTRTLSLVVAEPHATGVAAALRELTSKLPEHPGLLPVIDAGVQDDGRIYLVTPDVPAESLDVALAAYGPAAFADALPRLQQLADALDLAAQHGLVHGALSPSDVLVSADDTWCVGVGVRPALWRAGVTLPVESPYGAPEAAAGDAVTPAADQYALAVIAHEWLTGVHPDDGRTRVRAGLPDVDAARLSAALARALAADPAERFSSCGEFVSALAASAVAAPVRPAPAVLEFSPSSEDLPLHLNDEVLVAPRGPEAMAVSRGHERVGALAIALLAGVLIGSTATWLVVRTPSTPETLGGQAFTDADVAVAPEPALGPAPAPAAPVPAEPLAFDMAASSPTPSLTRSADAREDAALEAGLLIHSTPAGALVTVDGVARGVTPLAVRGLELGARAVALSRAGYQPVVRQVVLTPDRPSRALEVELAPLYRAAASTSTSAAADGVLVIDSRPAGAIVFIDGRQAGRTPLTMTLAPGRYAVRFERVGYRPVTTRVELAAGARERVAARLEGGLDEE